MPIDKRIGWKGNFPFRRRGTQGRVVKDDIQQVEFIIAIGAVDDWKRGSRVGRAIEHYVGTHRRAQLFRLHGAVAQLYKLTPSVHGVSRSP